MSQVIRWCRRSPRWLTLLRPVSRHTAARLVVRWSNRTARDNRIIRQPLQAVYGLLTNVYAPYDSRRFLRRNQFSERPRIGVDH